MSSDKPGDNQASGNQAETNGQLLPERVAGLAGELTEAQDESRRRRLARQIPALASRSGQATWRGLATGRDVAWQRLQSGAGAAAKRIRPVTEVAARNAQAGAGVAKKGARTGGSATLRGLRAGGQWLAAQVLVMAPKIPIRDLATLRAQHPAFDTEQLADSA